MSLVLVTHGEIGSGAMAAHVHGLARGLRSQGTVQAVSLAEGRLWASVRGRELLASHAAALQGPLDGRVLLRPTWPRGRGRPLDARLLAQALRSLVGSGPAILDARGHRAALLACDARDLEGAGWRVLHDVRGDRVAEVLAHGGEAAPDEILAQEEEATRRADACTAVSSPLAELLRTRGARGEVEVFPCAADTERFRPNPEARAELRRQLGVEGEDFVLGYVGSTAGWQRPDAVLALHRRVLEARPDAQLLVLTPSVADWQALAREGLPTGARHHVTRVPHADVPRWLSACDATALLRDADGVNAVASPIKFGESLACGVPVWLTEGIGDATRAVADEELGLVFSGPELDAPLDGERLAAYLGEGPEARRARSQRCRDFALAAWSWAEQLPRWQRLHERLLQAADMGESET